MDAFYPFMVRPFQPAEPGGKLISPVSRYVRISRDEHHHYARMGWRAYQQRANSQEGSQDGSQQHPDAEPTLLQTTHAETPEAEQHPDADGHLDIYI